MRSEVGAMKKPGFYWAWDDEGNAQPVEAMGNGKLLVIGVGGPVPENYFVSIGEAPIEHPDQ